MGNQVDQLLSVKGGIICSLFTLIYGFGLGGVFGAFEDGIKGHLKSKAEEVLELKYHGDEAAMKKVTDKSWVYFKRAHLHANGLGTASLAMILLLSYFPAQRSLKAVTALGLGIGSFGYAFFWMLAGLRAPSLGSTGAAKESLKWLAVPSSALCIAGLSIVTILGVKFLFVYHNAISRKD